MDELNRGRQLAWTVAAAAEQARCGQCDERTNAFAAGVDQMRGQVWDRADGARQILMYDRVNGGEVFRQKRREPVHRMGCAGRVFGRSGRRSQKALRLTFLL